MEEEEVAEEVYATVEGMEDDVGALLTNPAHVIRVLLTDSNFLGLSSAFIDTASFQSAAEWFDQQGFVYERVISSHITAGRLLHEALREAGAVLVNAEETLKLRVFAADDYGVTPAFISTAGNIVEEGIRLESPASSKLVNVLRMYAGEHENVKMIRFEDTISQNLHGVHSCDVHLNWHRGLSRGLTKLAAALLRRYAVPRPLLELEHPPVASHLEPADRVDVAEQDYLSLQETGALSSMKVAPGGTGWRLGILLSIGGLRCWVYDDATYIRHMPGNLDKEIVIEGSPVARIDYEGNLFIENEAVEFGIGEYYSELPVYYDAGKKRILFGTPVAADTYRCTFAITSKGALLVYGDIREYSTADGAAAAGCYTSTEDFFALSIDGEEVLLSYATAQECLHVKGEIHERTCL